MESGFSLVELLVAMAITAIITGVIGTAMIVGLRTTDATAERLNESHDALLLSTYLIRDLQSVAATGVDTAIGASTGCAPVAIESDYTGWRNVLTLTWTEDAGGGPVTYRAAYRLGQRVDDSRWQLLRIACEGSGASTALLMAHQLAAPTSSAVTTPAVAVSTVQLPTVVMTLQEPSGYTYSVSGQRRTPDTVSPAPPVWQCTVLSAIAKPDPATRATVAPGPLTENLRIEVQSGGACSSLRITVKPNDTSSRTVALSESPAGSGFWTTTIPAVTDVWTDGEKSFPISNVSVVVATLNLTVKQACIASVFAGTPVSTRRTQSASPSALQTDIALTAQATGVCLPLSVVYEPRAGETASVDLVPGAAGTWTGTIPAAAHSWSDGPVVLKLREPIGPDLATATITVTPSCHVVSSVAAPNPAQTGTGQSKNKLTTDVALSITTDGLCTGLDVQFVPGEAGSTAATVSLSETTPGVWTGTLSGSNYDWTTGTKALTVRDGFGVTVHTFGLVVS